MIKIFKKYMKRNKKFKIDKLVTHLTIFLVAIYFISLTFDFSVTMSIALYNSNEFVREGNILFKNAIEDNRPFLNFPILFGLFYPLLVLVSLNLYLKYKNIFTGTIYLSLLLSTVIFISAHFMGGYSWWVSA